MSVRVNGTVYTIIDDQDFIDLQLMMADGVTPRDLSGHTDIKVRLENDVDDSTIVFTKSGDAKVTVISESEGKIRISQDGDEYAQQSVYTYYVDIIDSIGSHAVPMRQELRPKWYVAAKIGV